ncbi:MAG: branched-chain amino acid aminotransferase [Sphingobacteriales bacterium]|nr:MAG: branched-chain amino acid aminotransferase [Sphingobacteriales bacterium]TAF80757.1 MAG: branched-chain amino acid aminotransferase [Sphingobacteriales bacterium]
MTETLAIKITKVNQSRLPMVDFENLQFGKIFTDHMFTADYANGEWGNFQIVPYGEISISPAMSSLHYGQSFFEGLKAFKHSNGSVSIFRPDKNAERFNASAERMCMPTLPEEIFIESITTLVNLEKNWIPNQANSALYIRPYMFATDPFLGVAPSTTYKYIVLTCPVGAYFSKNLHVKIETEFSRASEGGFGYAKCAGNYGGAMYPSKLGTQQGFDQLMWTDSKNHAYIEEMGAANIMFLIDGKLITPTTRDTVLNGVTRDSVITLAQQWGIPVEERRISVAEIIEAAQNGKLTDAFGAGTAAGVASVISITHNQQTYDLPNPTLSEFTQRISKTLLDIKYGKLEDVYGWNLML